MNCALITGASKGIGKAIALQLSKDQNLHLLINFSADINSAEKTLNDITSAGGSAELIKFKVQDKAEVDKKLNIWHEKNPDKTISVIVNNAGIIKDNYFIWMSESDWDDVINVSLKGIYNVSQNIIRYMMKNKFGRIINITSISGVAGIPGQVNYSAAKAGIIGATKALAKEFGKMKITVNAVAPGSIDTDMLKDFDVKDYLKQVPLGRMGKPEEVADLVSFLASEKASYITGEVININGGIYS